MNLYLIRHTRPNIELIYCYGQTDLDVAKTFTEEASRVKRLLPQFADVKIYSSPLMRCKKLAEFLDLGEVNYDNRLKEFNFGEWEMLPWKDINKKAFDNWVKDFVNLNVPGGESYQEMNDRVMTFFKEEIISEKSDVVVVSHGGVIRAILANILHMPLKYMFRMNIDFGAVNKVITDKGELKVDFLNR